MAKCIDEVRVQSELRAAEQETVARFGLLAGAGAEHDRTQPNVTNGKTPWALLPKGFRLATQPLRLPIRTRRRRVADSRLGPPLGSQPDSSEQRGRSGVVYPWRPLSSDKNICGNSWNHDRRLVEPCPI